MLSYIDLNQADITKNDRKKIILIKAKGHDKFHREYVVTLFIAT